MPGRLTSLQAILWGTLVVGTLDALDAIVFFGLRGGARPIRIFQGIASGLIGPAARQGGLKTAALGVFLHYFIAFGIVTTYFVVSRRVRLLTRRPVICGLVYGLLAYAVMNLVVIPLSKIGGPSMPAAPVVANGLLIHIFGVGLPSALFAAAARP
ncbi:MAG TPA: hypothetical protein VF921_06970 [Vicinamibacterales bacterium]